MKKLYGIGVGPGDPELLTIKGYKAIMAASAIFVPDRNGESTAEAIVKEYIGDKSVIPVGLVMGEDNDERYEKAAELINKKLKEGETGVFLTLGDPMVYSTFLYLMKKLEKSSVEVEAIPGVSSFVAAANRVNMPLTLKGESFYLCDGPIDEELLKSCDSVAILKTSKNKEKTLEQLKKHGFSYVYVRRCSCEDEEILYEDEKILKDKNYMSLLLGRKKND